MRLSHFFIDRPRFATVLSIAVMAFALLAGLILHLRKNPARTAKDHKVTNKTTIVESLGRSI